MPVYVYKAVTKSGLVVKNKVEEASKQSLIRRLKSNNLYPIDIIQTAYKTKANKKKKKNTTDIHEVMENINTTRINRQNIKKMSTTEKINLYLAGTEKITTRDIVIFTQNFYLLKKANFNNIHALSTIIQSTENISLKGILEDILAGVEAGEYMYTTMEYYEDVFPYIYINMIKVGELSGSLTKSLQQAVEYLDNTEALNRKLRSILIPNIAMFFALLAMLIVGTLVAIPQIQKILEDMGSKETLPAVTLWFQSFIEKVMEVWPLPTAIIVGIIAAIVIYIKATPDGKYRFHKFKYTMPIFGKLIFALDFSRLMKAMELNLTNGMRIQESLEVSKNIISNYVMLATIETAINNMLTGYSWIEPFETSGFASPMTTEMLKIGMQTDLTEMISKLVEYMDLDIDIELERIMKTLPQVVYAIVGVVLIFFVLVVLVPCIQMYMGNFLFSAYGV